MEMILTICAVISAVLSIGLACFFRYREKKTLQRIGKMLDAAISGDFREKEFDESLLSAVEGKMVQYLLASSVSARNLSIEKDKIKTLIADISHQTKTPLSNVLLYTELLSEEALSAESRIYVEALGEQAKKLKFLIDALVKTSRLETGILTMRLQSASVSSMLLKAVDEFAGKASEKGISLKLETCEDTAVFDPKWTGEAVCNLIENAIKYTPCGGKVTVQVQSYDLFCRIDVADNGIGMEESVLPKIFGRFYRAPNVAEQEGVGIGLYLVRQIAAGQGGYVKVSSSLGEGSVFSLFLPKN